MMEVLAGARDVTHAAAIRRLLLENEMLGTFLPGRDAESAATLYRQGRRRGITIRAMNDCLIAAVAIRREVPLLHEDGDFEAIAGYSPLVTVTP